MNYIHAIQSDTTANLPREKLFSSINILEVGELIILLDYMGITFLRDFRATLGRESIGHGLN